jgi:hypothetical protein
MIIQPLGFQFSAVIFAFQFSSCRLLAKKQGVAKPVRVSREAPAAEPEQTKKSK